MGAGRLDSLVCGSEELPKSKSDGVQQEKEDGVKQRRNYTGRERRQRMLLRLSVVLWVAACCLALCGKAAGAGL